MLLKIFLCDRFESKTYLQSATVFHLCGSYEIFQVYIESEA